MNEIKAEMIKCRSEIKPLYIPGGHNFKMGWEEYMGILANVRSEIEIFCRCDSHIHSDKRFVGHDEDGRSILLYNKFDPVIFGVNRLSENIIKAEEYLKSIGIPLPGFKLISNFVGYENTYGVHPDPHDVISFNLLGNVEYRIFYNVAEKDYHTNTEEYEYTSYLLRPGDMIYMPKGLVHQVVVSEPRITLVADFYSGF